MSDGAAIDLVRWSFTADPARRGEIEAYLADLGLDVSVRDEARFTVLWDEPEGDPGEIVDRLWEINGQPFDVIHEEFHRLDISTYHVEDQATGEAA